MIKKWQSILIVLGVISLVGGTAYSLRKAQTTPTAAAAQSAGGGFPVLTAKVTPSQLIDEVAAVGSLEAEESATLRSETAGNIIRILFKEGQTVTQGDELLTIDDSVLQTEVARAKASYDIAKTTWLRNSALRKTGVISAQAQDEAAATLSERKANYDNAQVRLQKTKIIAPFSGIMGLTELSPGDYVDVGDTIATLVDIQPIKVKFNIPEKMFAKVKEKQTLFVTVDAWPTRQFTGTVYAIDPNVDLQTRMISLKATIDNSDSILKPGMFASIKLRFGIKEQALMIPEEAIIPQGKNNVVMRVVNGKVVTTPVQLGSRLTGTVEITEGLSAGDEVITSGQMKVQDGMPVQSLSNASARPSSSPSPSSPASPPQKAE